MNATALEKHTQVDHESRPALVRTREGLRLEASQVLRRPLSQVFEFFERPENLEDITPAFLRFRIQTPRPVPMHQGAWIDYQLALFGIPIRWRTEITRYEKGRSFVDEQRRGPFARWVHEHEFREHEAGTLMIDRVEFRAPFGILGRIAEWLFVGRLVRHIFAHRRSRIAELVEGTAS